MLRLLRNRRAQSTAEYAILIAVVIGAAIAMQTYVKRAWQGNLKSQADSLGFQYEPYYLSSDFNTQSAGSTGTNTALGGGVTRNIDRNTDRHGVQIFGASE